MSMKYMDFNKAREFVRSLNLKSWREWKIYSENNRPDNIPSNPNIVYRDKWGGYENWINEKFDPIKIGNRKNSVNHDFFKKWSSNMAYILGFWWADGCVFRNEFSINQNKKDKYLLEKIRTIMSSSAQLKELSSSNQINFWVTSRTIVDDIKNLGGMERKSLVIDFPKIPKKYLPDFIRGYFDGDGCISYNKNSNGFESLFTSGSEKFSRCLFAVLKDNIKDIGGSFTCYIRKGGDRILGRKIKRSGKTFSIRLRTNDTIRLGKYMYQNDPYLKMERKYNLFKMAGEIKALKRGFLDYEQSEEIVHKLGIRSKTEWRNFCRQGLRQINIPSTPSQTYKNKGWVSWKKWLGYEKRRVKGEK